jgi:type IV secretory pathway TraG/TraD family ATPase VirD4
MMNPDDKRNIRLALILLLPILFWLAVAKRTENLTHPKLKVFWGLLKHTHERPLLLLAIVGGLALAILLIWLMNKLESGEFRGAYFHKFLRGTKIVSGDKLKRITKEKDQEQVMVAGIPMPSQVENLHLLVSGSTGAGKSVLIRELVYTGLLRGDRMIIADPDGDMLSKFWQEGDVILNPYDSRTEGWSFFNEIRNDYDFKRYALSIVPRGISEEAEEWASYARLLLRETAHKLLLVGRPSMRELFRLTTIAQPEELKEFLTGTDAESLFVGADKALASARFVLSDKLPEHINMPEGNFSLRNWLDKADGGSLYITWREDMAETLKPLISAWVDVLCTSVLSLPDDEHRRLWMILDELSSLEKLASLESALTKGRKKGLRVVAGLQSTAQLDNVYREREAQTLRSCFRSLVVLGGAKTDPKTCEDMSTSLGEHEVERDSYSKNISSASSTRGGTSTTTSTERLRERVIMPSEIASLPNLEGYIAFAGDIPIARISLNILQFKNKVQGFKAREV